MYLALNEEPRELASAAREVLAKECPPSVIRSAWSAPRSAALADPVLQLWRCLAELGVPALLVPDELGGLGLDEVHLVALMEEVGRHAPPLPVLETICAAPAIVADRPDEAERLAAGDAVVAWAPAPPALVPWGEQASMTLLGGSPANRDLTLVPGRWVGDGVETVDRARPVAGCPADVRDRAVQLTVCGNEVDRLWLRGVLGTAAQLVGLAARMVDITVEYVSGRTQFGVPVGSFQAVKHALADAHLAVEFARPVVLRAAWSLSRDAPAVARDISMAKVLAGRAATRTARTAIQCHGGMGYTTEYDLHLFAKRAWALNSSFGTVKWHRDLVAEAALPHLAPSIRVEPSVEDQ